jgi:hypothetical protein
MWLAGTRGERQWDGCPPQSQRAGTPAAEGAAWQGRERELPRAREMPALAHTTTQESRLLSRRDGCERRGSCRVASVVVHHSSRRCRVPA